MNRKEFLENCACVLCSCAAAGMIVPAAVAADEKKGPEDWRLPFVKNRYACLLNILAGQMDEKAFGEVLRQLGYHCASQYALIQQHKGDIADKLRLSGSFALRQASFTGPTVQDKIDGLSSRAQGKPGDKTVDEPFLTIYSSMLSNALMIMVTTLCHYTLLSNMVAIPHRHVFSRRLESQNKNDQLYYFIQKILKYTSLIICIKHNNN